MDKVITEYQRRLNLEKAIFSRIDHEDALVAIVYKVTGPNGQQLILKISDRPNDFFREVYFLNYFAGRLPVPRIIQVIQPEAGVNGAILMECLPGTLLNTKDFHGELAYEIGAFLARIHLNRVPGYGDLIQQSELNNDPRVYFTLKFDEGLDECSKHLPKVLLEECRNYFDRHLHLLASVDGPCIVHRDFRPGNLIVYQGCLNGIIDWAGARASFAEEDFCSLEHGEWSNNSNGKESFLTGYASIRPVPDYKDLMPLLRLNKAVATIGFTVKRGTWKSSNLRLYNLNRQFLETLFNS